MLPFLKIGTLEATDWKLLLFMEEARCPHNGLVFDSLALTTMQINSYRNAESRFSEQNNNKHQAELP